MINIHKKHHIEKYEDGQICLYGYTDGDGYGNGFRYGYNDLYANGDSDGHLSDNGKGYGYGSGSGDGGGNGDGSGYGYECADGRHEMNGDVFPINYLF